MEQLVHGQHELQGHLLHGQHEHWVKLLHGTLVQGRVKVVSKETGRRQYVPKWMSVNSLKKESVLKSIFLCKVAL